MGQAPGPPWWVASTVNVSIWSCTFNLTTFTLWTFEPILHSFMLQSSSLRHLYSVILRCLSPSNEVLGDTCALLLLKVFNPAVMTVQCSVPILEPVECKLSKMWQILHDPALKIVADFSQLFDFGTLPFRNLAHGKKRNYILKKVTMLSPCQRGVENYFQFKLLILPQAKKLNTRSSFCVFCLGTLSQKNCKVIY